MTDLGSLYLDCAGRIVSMTKPHPPPKKIANVFCTNIKEPDLSKRQGMSVLQLDSLQTIMNYGVVYNAEKRWLHHNRVLESNVPSTFSMRT